MEVIGICLLFGFLLMAFWGLVFLFSVVGGWAAEGAKVMMQKKMGKVSDEEGVDAQN